MENSTQPQLSEGDIKEVQVKSEEEDLDEKEINDDKGIKAEPVEKSTDAEFIAKKTEEEASRGEYKEISAHPDFLCIAQFIGTFGSLLGIPNFFIDTIEDGLNSSTSQIDEDSYLNACGNAVEQLLISLLRRCGVLTNVPKLSSTLQSYFEDRDPLLHSSLGDSVFNNLPKMVKLGILKFVCLSQFDENSRFKTEFNSQYSPDDLRFLPLGRDFESSQYWFISDSEKSHRLYRWKYPYTPKQWTLLSRSYSQLQTVVERLRPPESDQQLRQGKLWEIVNVQKVEIPLEKTDVKKAKKKKKKKKEQIEASDEQNIEDDLEVAHRINRYELGMRKSARNVNRKVYTEPNEDNETSEEEEDSQHKEHDEKYKKAVDIARSRKRSRKHLRISQSDDIRVLGTPMSRVLQEKPKPKTDPKMENHPYRKLKQHEKEALADSFINFNNVENEEKKPRNNKSKDPFAFSDLDSSSKQSDDSSGSLGFTVDSIPNNGQTTDNNIKSETRHPVGNCVRRPIQQKGNITKEFLESVKEIPSLSNVQKPEQAEDKCWRCEGEENVDKMLFCDGCDLATYHMACLLPPIGVVPDDDWYCPVCEQVLLYLHLRLKLDKLRIYTYVPRISRGRARKTYSAPTSRSNTCRARRSQNYRPTPRPVSHSGYTLGRTIPSKTTLITPSRPVHYRYVTPRARPKIGQIDRLAETARKVFDHSLDEEDSMSPLEHRRVKVYKTSSYYGKSRYGQNTYADDSESDCEVVYPDEVDSEGSSDSEFSHRPRGKPLIGQTPPGLIQKAEKKYTADDFLAEPTKTNEISKPTSKMGYNPLASSRGLIRPTNRSTSVMSVKQSKDLENKGFSSPHASSRDDCSHDRVTHTARRQETTGHRQETTGHRQETTGHRQETTGHRQETTGHRQETTARRQETTGHRQETTARRQETTARRQETTARRVGTTPRIMNHGNQTVARSTTKKVDTATAILEGRRITSDERERIEDSRSGNVVTQTAQLSDVQRRALALYEADNKRRSKDAFDFDD